MTSIENYSRLIDSIFGIGTTTFSTTDTHYNHVIGALNHTTQYKGFTANFTARLQRLKLIYSTHPNYMRDILVKVNEVSSKKNWEGAYAELAAYDHLNQDILNHKTYINNPIKPNVTLSSTVSFAQELGKQVTNLDGFVEDRPLYFDVKCFKDNVTEILEGIYVDLKKHLRIDNIHITAEHALDTSYEDYQTNRRQLLNEMKTGITVTNKENYFRSTIIPNLSFRILWGAGVQTAELSYHPFIHAENFHKTVFNYANKFMKNEPNIIALVVFPWYNLVVTDFSNSNLDFYRALSRRVFCQYKHDTTLFKTFNSKFTGNHTIYEVSNHLSGIIFLEDNTILSKDPDKTNVKSFVYLNPNAVKPLTKSLASDFIRGLHNLEYDDFDHDNY
jgi:hypothetical protein